MNRQKFGSELPPFLTALAAALVHALANTFTLIIVALVIALVFFEQTGDALFLASTISVNALIAVIQEVRAKQALRRLALLGANQVRIRRETDIEYVDVGSIRVGDHVILSPGSGIPADGTLIENDHLTVNQAMLTGEAAEITVHPQEHLYAGSFVVAGTGILRVTAIGSDTRAGRMSAKLKWYQTKLTPLQLTLASCIRGLTYIAIILGLLIYFDGLRSGVEIAQIVSTIASGAISVVPEGLLLASTVLYTYGALKLVKKHVLIQRTSAVEGFSRLDILCFDKTGTLTSGTLTLDGIIPVGPFSQEDACHLLVPLLTSSQSKTSTVKALTHAVKLHDVRVLESIPFTSAKRFSAALFKEGPTRRAVALGAPETLFDESKLLAHPESAEAWQKAKAAMRTGKRVVAIADYGTTVDVLAGAMRRTPKAVAFFILKATVRTDAIDTAFYLQAQGVQLKIISGDNTETVQAVARDVGILNWRHTLSGDQLAAFSDQEWEKRVPETTLFARILPEQKERIILTLKKHGFTGMVGDGINDTLAIKAADLGIAMAEGSEAARQVADVVLLDNRFASLPEGMRRGSQIVLGLEMVTYLFFNRIFMGMTVLLLSLVTSFPYPFTTRHLLVLNIFTVGIPTVLWSLFPARAAKRLPAKGMFWRVLLFALPNGVLTGVAAAVAYLSFSMLHPGNDEPASTAAFFLTLCMGIFTFWIIPRAAHAIRNYNLRWWPWLYTGAALTAIIAGSQFGISQALLSITGLHFLEWAYLAIITTIGCAGLLTLTRRKKHYVSKPLT